MKTIGLSLKRIIGYFKNSTAKILIFCLVGILAGALLIVIYGNSVHEIYGRVFITEEMKVVSYETNEAIEGVENLADNFDSELYKFIRLGHPIVLGDFLSSYENAITDAAVYSYPLGVNGRELYKGSSADPGPGEIILGRDFYPKYSVGDSFNLYGKEFTVSGIHMNRHHLVISPIDFENMNTDSSSILFLPYENLSSAQLVELDAQVSGVFSSPQLIPNVAEQELQYFNLYEYIIIAAKYLLLLLILIPFIKALTNKNKKLNPLRAIKNFNKWQLFIIVTIETAVLNFINLIIASVVHFAFYDILFSRIPIFIENIPAYRFGDYLSIVVFGLVISTICLIPVFYHYEKKLIEPVTSKVNIPNVSLQN